MEHTNAFYRAQALDQERKILDGVMLILKGKKSAWSIYDSLLSDQYPDWSCWVTPNSRSRIRISVKFKTMELILWHPNLDHWHGHGAIIGKLDLNNPRSLVRSVLREALRKANTATKPLERIV